MTLAPLTTDNLLNIAALLVGLWGIYLTKKNPGSLQETFKKNLKSDHQNCFDGLIPI